VTIEEVISIAKTLKPGFICISMYDSQDEIDPFAIEYFYNGSKEFVGKSWEQALFNAGWKG